MNKNPKIPSSIMKPKDENWVMRENNNYNFHLPANFCKRKGAESSYIIMDKDESEPSN